MKNSNSILLQDQIFKYVFKHEEMAKYLINAINDYLNIDLKYGHVACNVEHILMADNINTKDFYNDLFVTTDNGDIILLEAYTTFGLREYKKSEAYLDRVSSDNYKKGNKYNNKKRIICINFVPKKATNSNIIKKYGILDLETLKEPFRNINEYKQMLVIKVDKYETKNYNKSDRLIQILDFMGSIKMSELEEKAKEGNIFMEQALEFIKSYLADESNKGFGSHYDYDVECAREEGEKNGRKNQKRTIAKKMIDLGLSNEIINQTTNLSIKEIEKLRKNNK